MTWYQIWTVCWQIAVFLTPMLVGIAVLWLKSQFVTKADAKTEQVRVDGRFSAVGSDARAETNRVNARFDASDAERDRRWEKVRDQLSDHEGRIKAAETDLSRPPTRHALNNELTKVVSSNAALERTIAGLGDQVKTVHTYLHTLVERGLDGK